MKGKVTNSDQGKRAICTVCQKLRNFCQTEELNKSRKTPLVKSNQRDGSPGAEGMKEARWREEPGQT